MIINNSSLKKYLFQMDEIFAGKLDYESLQLKSIRNANSFRLIA